MMGKDLDRLKIQELAPSSECLKWNIYKKTNNET